MMQWTANHEFKLIILARRIAEYNYEFCYIRKKTIGELDMQEEKELNDEYDKIVYASNSVSPNINLDKILYKSKEDVVPYKENSVEKIVEKIKKQLGVEQ